MFSELIEREGVDIEFTGRSVFDGEIILGIERKPLDFIELIHTDITAQTLAIRNDLAGIIGADARYCFQCCRVGSVQYNMLAGLDLFLIRGSYRIL
jgi:hypothetical protein